jgi:hypothetical protein
MNCAIAALNRVICVICAQFPELDGRKKQTNAGRSGLKRQRSSCCVTKFFLESGWRRENSSEMAFKSPISSFIAGFSKPEPKQPAKAVKRSGYERMRREKLGAHEDS